LTFAATFGFRYPDLGDPKPRADQEVLLIREGGKHERGVWKDDGTCKAWALLHAKDRKKPTKESTS
jgi:hypothetical protein